MMLILVNVSWSGVYFILYSYTSIFNDGICVDPLASTVITISGHIV